MWYPLIYIWMHTCTCHRAANVPLLSNTNRLRRARWVVRMANWNWNRVCASRPRVQSAQGFPVSAQVIFSDEKRFLVYGDRPLRVWRRQGQRLQANFLRQRTQSRVGIMCWLALKSDGSSRLIRCPDKVDSLSYQRDILTPSLPFIRGSWFQQDNAPPHVSRSTLAWLARKRVKVLPGWPACSPDLNLVEHAWAAIARNLVNQRFTSADALWHGIQGAWAAVQRPFVRSLWRSMPRRLQAVRKARGGATPY